MTTRIRVLLYACGCSGGLLACTTNNNYYGVQPLPAETGEETEDTAGKMPTTGELPGPTGTTAASEMTEGSGGWVGTTSGAGAVVCGNGVVEEGEACDLGLEGNADDGACTSVCQAAICGDGHVQASNGEACDDGPYNEAMPGFGECSTACALGPGCGDGVVQPEHGEDCEASEGGDADNCTSSCVYAARYMFVTSVGVAGDLGGLAGADAWCTLLSAYDPKLSGKYRAWLLADGQSLGERFPEYEDSAAGWTFMNAADMVLAKSFAQLVEQGPARPILYAENGEPKSEVPVWTNITATGQAAGGDCEQWTGTTGTALVGLTGVLQEEGPEAEQWREGRWWTDYVGTKRPCKYALPHLYCVQVAG